MDAMTVLMNIRKLLDMPGKATDCWNILSAYVRDELGEDITDATDTWGLETAHNYLGIKPEAKPVEVDEAGRY